MSLIDKLTKNSKIKLTSLIKESKVFGKKDVIPTSVPAINVALQAKLDGGMLPGLLQIAGPSKHFKSAFAVLLAASFLKKYSDGVILFYDSEFGTPQAYFETFGVDMDRVIHTPIKNVEELKFDIMNQLENIEKEDHVMVIIDSIGNLASKKEVEDALKENTAADMSRAKQMKSLFRMVTPYLNLKDIPLIAVNHTYKEMSLFPKDIVSGGTGGVYSSDAIWIVGRQQEKDGSDLAGYNFIINIEKSRHVKEKSKIPITVTFDGGIQRWSGMLDWALEGGYVVKPKNGWYQRIDKETGEFIGDKMFRAKEIENNSEFWKTLIKETDFADWITQKYQIASGSILEDEEEETTE